MRKVLLTLSLGLSMAFVSQVAALALGRPQTNPQACPDGKQVVNVTYTLTNDLDSAVGGQNWANDTLNRHLQIFRSATANTARSFRTTVHS